MELTPEERQRIYQEEKARRGGNKGRLVVGCLVVLGLAGLMCSVWFISCISKIATTSGTRLSTAQPSASSQPELLLLAQHCNISRGGGMLIVEGQVQNTSPRSMDFVIVVAEGFDKDGNFVSSQDAPVDYRPLLPGQRSPFTVIMNFNPAIARCGVTGFKDSNGRQILHSVKPAQDR